MRRLAQPLHLQAMVRSKSQTPISFLIEIMGKQILIDFFLYFFSMRLWVFWLAGVAIDQGIAYVLMLAALVVTYLLH